MGRIISHDLPASFLFFSCQPGHPNHTQQATTAAGDQAFLGRYHRQAGLASKERKGGKRDGSKGHETSGVTTTTTGPWVGTSVPLATNHAVVAVCASRGWVAVCTGSVVSLCPADNYA